MSDRPETLHTRPWSTVDITRLKAYVDDGLSQSEIGEKLGRSKFAISNRMRILGIRSKTRHTGHGPQKPKVPRFLTKKPLSEVFVNPLRSCAWIDGQPQGAKTLFCGDPVVPMRSYCAKHYAIAYVAKKVA